VEAGGLELEAGEVLALVTVIDVARLIGRCDARGDERGHEACGEYQRWNAEKHGFDHLMAVAGAR